MADQDRIYFAQRAAEEQELASSAAEPSVAEAHRKLQRAYLERRYPGSIFVGSKQGEDLAEHYAAADVFVFPSLTDTFGLVVLEALASGVPVAAFPVAGPKDVIGDSGAGALHQDLRTAITRALQIPAARCRAHAETFSWRGATRQFLQNLALIPLQQPPHRW